MKTVGGRGLALFTRCNPAPGPAHRKLTVDRGDEMKQVQGDVAECSDTRTAPQRLHTLPSILFT